MLYLQLWLAMSCCLVCTTMLLKGIPRLADFAKISSTLAVNCILMLPRAVFVIGLIAFAIFAGFYKASEAAMDLITELCDFLEKKLTRLANRYLGIDD